MRDFQACPLQWIRDPTPLDLFPRAMISHSSKLNTTALTLTVADAFKDELANAGVVPVLAAVIEGYAEEPAVIEHCFGALRNFAANYNYGKGMDPSACLVDFF